MKLCRSFSREPTPIASQSAEAGSSCRRKEEENASAATATQTAVPVSQSWNARGDPFSHQHVSATAMNPRLVSEGGRQYEVELKPKSASSFIIQAQPSHAHKVELFDCTQSPSREAPDEVAAAKDQEWDTLITTHVSVVTAQLPRGSSWRGSPSAPFATQAQARASPHAMNQFPKQSGSNLA